MIKSTILLGITEKLYQQLLVCLVSKLVSLYAPYYIGHTLTLENLNFKYLLKDLMHFYDALSFLF